MKKVKSKSLQKTTLPPTHLVDIFSYSFILNVGVPHNLLTEPYNQMSNTEKLLALFCAYLVGGDHSLSGVHRPLRLGNVRASVAGDRCGRPLLCLVRWVGPADLLNSGRKAPTA